MARPGIVPDEPGVVGPLTLIEELKKMGHQIAYVGDVVGTGSSRKSQQIVFSGILEKIYRMYQIKEMVAYV